MKNKYNVFLNSKINDISISMEWRNWKLIELKMDNSFAPNFKLKIAINNDLDESQIAYKVSTLDEWAKLHDLVRV